MTATLKTFTALWFACAGLSFAGDTTIPYLSGRVVDQAEILTGTARSRIGALLQAHEEATGNQIAVLTINSIGAQGIEDFAARVFETWKLGSAHADNGVLILVAPHERRLRIEVGGGLEDSLTDVAADRIVRNLMTPRFREGNYDVGIEAGATAIIQILEGRQPVSADWAAPADAPTGLHLEAAPMPPAQRILVSVSVFGLIGIFTFIGLVTPGSMGRFLYFFLLPFWSIFPMAIFGSDAALFLFTAYVLIYPLAKAILARVPRYHKSRDTLHAKDVGPIGGMAIRPGATSGGPGSFLSGGGYSGGGGRSGDRGASASW